MKDVISENQDQTKNTFSYKWAKTDSYESDAFKDKARTWLIERYCNNDKQKKHLISQVFFCLKRIDLKLFWFVQDEALYLHLCYHFFDKIDIKNYYTKYRISAFSQ